MNTINRFSRRACDGGGGGSGGAASRTRGGATRRFRVRCAAAVVAAAGFASTAGAAQFFATQVIGSPDGGTSNQPNFRDPSQALGAPTGQGNPAAGGEGSVDVYNLGVSGSITLGFDDGATRRAIANGPGADFIVFENAFYAEGDPARAFAELVFVEVSSDGQQFARFPNSSTTPPPASGGQHNTIDVAKVSGFAGVHPVFANANDPAAPSAFDAARAGGDAFDLAQLASDPLVLTGAIDLAGVRFVRLVDVRGDGTVADTTGDPIYDPSGPISAGADIDAVAVVNGVPEPGAAGVLLGPLTVCVARRRRRP